MDGDELKEKREALGMTQQQLATALNVAANTVARWERGERSIPPHLPLALETVERDHSHGATKAKSAKPAGAAPSPDGRVIVKPKKRAAKKGGRK